MRRWLLLGLLLLGFSEPAGAASRYEIDLLTMAPGEALFARFGHNALLVHDRATGAREVYNFGTVYVGDPDLLSKYVARKLKYWLSMTDLRKTLASYRGRTVWAQRLRLSDEAKERLVTRVRWQAQPENREYLYDHFLDNCSTRIRDLLDEATGGALRRVFAAAPSGSTLRREVELLLGPLPFERFVLSYVLSGVTDRPATRWELMFLPRHLRDEVRVARVTSPDGTEHALVAGEERLVEGSVEPLETVSWPLWLVTAGLLGPLAVAATGGARRRSTRILAGAWLALWGLLCAAGSGVMIFLWTTELPATQANGTLWLNTPLHLLLVPLGIWLAMGRMEARGQRWLRALLAVLGLLAVGYLAAYAAGIAEKAQTGHALLAAAMSALGWVACRGAAVVKITAPEGAGPSPAEASAAE